MPIYEFECDTCFTRFEVIESFDESEKPHDCPVCKGGIGYKVVSIPHFRMRRIYDNAEFGPQTLFGEEHSKHGGWKELAEESEMVNRKREELKGRGELEDFVFEEGKYSHGPRIEDV